MREAAPQTTGSRPLPEGGVSEYAPWARSWWPALALIIAAALFRFAYLAWFCPYTLLEDEAHYWEWARRPGWSYYSKGPGVAWSIAASTSIFGNTELGVRFPAVVFATVGAIAAAGLARRATGDERAGFFAAAIMLLIPAFQLGGILMTIDMPYAALWAVGAWAGWSALSRGSRVAWPAMGLAIGASFLFKYTALLLVPGLLLFALVARRRLRVDQNWKRWALLGAVLLAACTLPVILWNQQHGWPTVRHLLGHLGAAGGDMPASGSGVPSRPWSPSWTMEFLGSQLALIGPVLILMAIAAARAVKLRRKDPEGWTGRLFLLCCAAPILSFYFILTFFTEGEGNWAVAAYMTLISLAGWAAVEGLQRQRRDVAAWERLEVRPWRGWIRRRPENSCQMAWHATLVVGIFLGLAPLKLDWLAASPLMRWVDSVLVAQGWMREGRTLVPTGRLMGARAMVGDVASLGDRLRRETGREPFFVAEHYGRAGLLAFYLPGNPVVYCSSSVLDEGRRTQYDYWRDTDLSDLRTLGGRPAVLIGSKLERWQVGFERVESIGRLEHETKERREAFLAYGYVGFTAGGD